MKPFFEILTEGEADVPTVREILQRRFQLEEETHFRILPHQGRGRLPENPQERPDPRQRGLLDQLPAKIRGYSALPPTYWLVVLIDADRDDCRELKQQLVELYTNLDNRPANVLFRIAVEEIESWFLADPEAIRNAYSKAKLSNLPAPDAVVGAWEHLAKALRKDPKNCTGADKYEWGQSIAPHLDLEDPKSPSLRAFIQGISRALPESSLA